MNEQTLFTQTIERPLAERRAFLDAACAGNAALRARVERLVTAHEEAVTFMDQPAGELHTSTAESLLERPGTFVGPYKLLQQIGEGGMGVVYMAEQTEPMKRRVALKIIKPGMDTRQVIARFEAERQALAVMDHPSIAKVLDAGTTAAGRPYFVMELVNGIPITQYCDEQHLTARERLALFIHVCEAVHHAHQKGIIHRDIKPTNILVALYDGRPVPKVIDFGVAKAISQRLTEKTMFTGLGQLVGTLEYMSPEQASRNQLDVDTRSDVYSLGVVLYELLAGQTPFDKQRLRSAAIDELLRIIREEEPPRPSTRLSSSETLPSVAANRRIQPAKLSALVRGELDWIVMKALEKDRGRRYDTASGLAMDVQRYLGDEPVHACPPSVRYRLTKFARRNQRVLAMASVVVLAILLIVGSLSWMVRDRLAREADIARERQDRRAKIESQVELVLEEAERWQREERWPEALAAAQRAQALMSADQVDARLTQRAHLLLKDLKLVEKLEELRFRRNEAPEPEQDSYTAATNAYHTVFADFGIDVHSLAIEQSAAAIGSHTSIVEALIAALDDWISCLINKNDVEGIRRIESIVQLIDTDDWRTRARSALTKGDWGTLDELLASADLLGQPPGTLQMISSRLYTSGMKKQGLELIRKAQRKNPSDFWLNQRLSYMLFEENDPAGRIEAIGYARAAVAARPRYAYAYITLGRGLRAFGRTDEAIECFRKSIELNPNTHYGYLNLALMMGDKQDVDESIRLLRKAIEVNPTAAGAHNNLGAQWSKLGRTDEAVACYQRAIEIDPNLAVAHSNLGIALSAKRCFAEAISSFQRALEIQPDMAAAYAGIAFIKGEQGRTADAITYYQRSLEIDPSSASRHHSLGLMLGRMGRHDEAINSYLKAIALDPQMARSHAELGVALRALNKLDEAVASLDKALAIDPSNKAAHCNRGNALAAKGDLAQAERAFRRALELDPKMVDAHLGMSAVLAEAGKYEDAAASNRRAIAIDAKSYNGHLFLGMSLERLGSLDEAQACYRTAIGIDPARAHGYFQLAYSLEKNGKTSEAITQYRIAVARDPKCTAAQNNLGGLLLRIGELEEGAKCIREAIAIDPKQHLAHYNMGVYWEKKGQFADALASYQTALELAPSNPKAYFGVASAFCAQHKHEESLPFFRKAIELDSKFAMAHNDLGFALSKLQRLDEAANCYQNAIEIDPSHRLAHRNLGSLLIDQGKFDKAIIPLRRATELRRDDAYAFSQLGLALLRNDQLDDAASVLHTAIDLDPKSSAPRGYLGELHLRMGNADQAILAFRSAIELDPKNANAHFFLGLAQSDQGAFDTAEVSLRKAVELLPGNALAQYNLGVVLLRRGKTEDAITCFRQAIKLNAKDTGAHVALGAALISVENYREAIAAFSIAAELAPNDAAILNGLAWLLATASDTKLRDPARAVELSKKAVELKPEIPDYPNTLGVAQYRTGDWNAARTALEKSVSIRKGGDANDWLFLAMVHWRLGDKGKAKEWFTKAADWMKTNQSKNAELIRFRAEAADLLMIDDAP